MKMRKEEGGEEREGGWKGVTRSQISDPSTGQTTKVGAGGGERKREMGYKYNSMAVHTKFDLDLVNLGQSTKVKRSCWQRVSPLTAHGSNTLTSRAGEGGGRGRGPRNVSGQGDALGSGIF